MKHLKVFEEFEEILEFAGKDIDRIESMKRKSGGKPEKILQYAQAMAKSIGNADKAYDRGMAAASILTDEEGRSEVSAVFFAKAEELGMDVRKEQEKPEPKAPASQRPDTEKSDGERRFNDPSPVLPLGMVDLKTGENEYIDFNDERDATIEVWQSENGRYRLVITAGGEPIEGIGTHQRFKHDQTGHKIGDWVMVDYTEVENLAGLIDLYGKKLPGYTYK